MPEYLIKHAKHAPVYAIYRPDTGETITTAPTPRIRSEAR